MNKPVIRADAVENVVRAIVTRAASDYRSIFRRRLYEKPITNSMEVEFNDLEEFFESEWFTFLTNMDGSYVMLKIEDDERKKKRKKLKIENEILI